MRGEGFTLLEVLVAMGIAGLIMVAILNLQQSTIQVTQDLNVSSDHLALQSAATGYVADRYRSAVKVRNTNTTTVSLGGTTTCDNSAASTMPCIAFVLPETTVNDPTGKITRYVELAFRYEPRTTFPDRRPNAWADTNGVELIREYRRVLLDCSALAPANCTLANALAATPGAWRSAVLADGLTRVEGAGTFSPWVFRPLVVTVPPAPVKDTDVLDVKIRSLYKRGSSGVYFPTAAPRTLSVQNRNGT